MSASGRQRPSLKECYTSGVGEARCRMDKTKGVTMRQKICILLMLAALSAARASAVEPPTSPPKPGSCPHALKPLPRSVTQVVDRILREIRPEFRKTLL